MFVGWGGWVIQARLTHKAINICLIPSYDFRFTTRSSLYYHMKELHNAAVTLPGQNQSQQFRCVIESCQQKFDTGAELGNHVTLSHALEMAAANATSIDSTDCGQRVSTGSQEPNDDCGDVDAAAAAADLDFIALLTSVGDDVSSGLVTNAT